MSPEYQQDRVSNIKNAICQDIANNPAWEQLECSDLLGMMFVSQESLKLTNQGNSFLSSVYEFYEFELTQPLTGRQIVNLKSRCHLPYFISRNRVVLYSSREAFRISLKGSIHDWLLSINKEKK